MRRQTCQRRLCILAFAQGTTPGNYAAKWDFSYDGDGTRAATLVTPYDENGVPETAVLTAYYFGGAYEVTGNDVRKYYSFGGQTILRDSTGLQYFLTDHLGSVVAITNVSGSILSQQRYLPFGQARSDVGTITQTDFGYTGQRDLTMGLMDYKARFYSPYITHFSQPDTIVPDPSYPQSLNRYSYVLNNPIRYVDPSGHTPCYRERIDDGPQCTRGGWINNSSNIIYDNWKYQDRVIRDSRESAINGLTNITITLDTIATIISIGEAFVADSFIIGTVILSGFNPELAPMIVEALKVDTLIAGPLNPIGDFENMLGGVSFGATAAADWLSGNTSLSGGYVGRDTIVAGRNALAGNIPESNVDLIINASQLKYDYDRLNGVKPGGSIRFTDVSELTNQFIWNDSPIQDVTNKIAEWKQFWTNPHSSGGR